MKRPPGLWLLLSAGVLWLCFQDVSCVRATSLIFGKSTTTTTAKSSKENESPAPAEEESATEVSPESSNSTKAPLTGIPQVDYLVDPNLPRELNGANLTEYPFFDRVPEEIDFKCDGLHDGFYASVPHKCQVYHHCLYGTRYDFLCANYTAFDQKTFICHFVSEVDCVNSKKFWHRNDALYKATTTSTIKPVIVYTPPPPPAILTGGSRRPGSPLNSRRRKPMRRRRPQYDYYEDYDEEDDEFYDEPRYTATEAPRSDARKRKRTRPRPRPIYDDEYEEYEDDRYERRRGGGRREDERDRRPYDRRGRPPSRRNKDERRKYEDEYEDEMEDEDPRFDKSEERKNKRPKEERRSEERKEERRSEERKEKRPMDERRYDKRRPDEDEEDDRRYRPRKTQRRPVNDDYEDDVKEERKTNRKNTETDTRKREEPPPVEEKVVVKPMGSVYDRSSRIPAPRIRPPVPKSEADKYSYKSSTSKPTAKPLDDEEYYDEYEEELPPKRSRPKADSSTASSAESRKSQKTHDDSREVRKPTSPRSRLRKPIIEDEYEYEEERPRRPVKPKNEERRVGQGSRKRPAVEEYEDYDESDKKAVSTTSSRPSFFKDRKYGREDKSKTSPTTTSTTPSTTTTSTTTTTTEAPIKEEAPFKSNVRIVKRPFLPSRGGNPYLARGLQPVGLRSDTSTESIREIQKPVETRKQTQDVDGSNSGVTVAKYQRRPEPSEQPPAEKEELPIEKEFFKPSPVIVKVPVRTNKYQSSSEEEYRPVSNRPINPSRYKPIKEFDPRTTAKPKPIEKNPLDINENEYDVTLNDALNPTLPNLPVRSFPTGFSVANDYTYSAFHRPRYVVDATINQASSEYNYRYKQPQRYETAQPAYNRNDQEYNAQYSGRQNYQSQNFRPSPRVAQTQNFFTTY